MRPIHRFDLPAHLGIIRNSLPAVPPDETLGMKFAVCVSVCVLASAASAAPFDPQTAPLLIEKTNRTAAQRKIDTQLLFALYRERGEAETKGVPSGDLRVKFDAKHRAFVSIRARVTKDLAGHDQDARRRGGSSSERDNDIRAYLPLAKLEGLAASKNVYAIAPAEEATANRAKQPKERLIRMKLNLRSTLLVALAISSATLLAGAQGQERAAGPGLMSERARHQIAGTDAGKGDPIARTPEDGFSAHLRHQDASRRTRSPKASTASWSGSRAPRPEMRSSTSPRTSAPISCGSCGRRARRFSAPIRSRTACAPRSASNALDTIAISRRSHFIQPMQEAITRQGATSQGPTRRSIPSTSGRRGPSSTSARATSPPRWP